MGIQRHCILTIAWINEELVPATGVSEDTPLLLVLDCVSFHKTEEIRALLKRFNVKVSMIPPGMTSLLQPLDTYINKTFKAYLREFTDKYTLNWETEHPGQKWSISDKRIMVTKVVALAWKRLCNTQQGIQLVRKSFIEAILSAAGIQGTHGSVRDGWSA